MGKKVRIIVSLLVVAIIGILIIPPQDNTNEVITQSNVITSDDINLDQDIIDEAFQSYSIVETERIFTESDQSLIEQFLDENDLPSSSEKFGIEVQTVLFDSYQNQYPSSSILEIPNLSVSDSEGRLLDLGSIQTSFAGIISNSDRGSETSFNLDGNVKFYLDDTLIAEKKLYFSEQGEISQSKTLDLSIVNTIPPPSFDRPKAFTFTLSDEGKDWVDGSEHTYRVVVTDINAELTSNKNIEKYLWHGEKIAYELKVKVDTRKIVVLNDENNPISIFKSDSTLQLCGSASHSEARYVSLSHGFSGGTVNVIEIDLDITDPKFNDPNYLVNAIENSNNNNNNVVATAEISKEYLASKDPYRGCSAKHCYGTDSANMCNAKIDGIPRNALVKFEILNLDNNLVDTKYVITPKSQKNYYYNYGAWTDVTDWVAINANDYYDDLQLVVGTTTNTNIIDIREP